jgi:hypothetical protein
MKILFRKILRSIVKYFCLIAINKHNLEIIAVGGWYGTDISREAVYTILKKSGKKVRRIIHSPTVDWDIPLTILGIRSVPNNVFVWIFELAKSAVRLLFLKSNPSTLVLQINSQDTGIMKYWMSFVHPDVVIMLNSHAGTLNLELLLVENVKPSGLLIVNNDNMRTKSLAQGKNSGIIYFGEKGKNPPEYYFSVVNNTLQLGHANEIYPLQKTFPEFTYPFLSASSAIAQYYSLVFKDVCEALNYFELPSDKIHTLFSKFVEE